MCQSVRYEDRPRNSCVVEEKCALAERRTDRRVNKIVLNRGKDYFKVKNELCAKAIEICVVAAYTPEKNGRAERIN